MVELQPRHRRAQDRRLRQERHRRVRQELELCLRPQLHRLGPQDHRGRPGAHRRQLRRAAVAPPGLPHLGLPRRRHPGQGCPGDHGVVVRELHHHQQHARQPARPHQHVGLERLALRERLEAERRHGRLVPGHLQHEAQLGAVLHAHLPVHGLHLSAQGHHAHHQLAHERRR